MEYQSQRFEKNKKTRNHFINFKMTLPFFQISDFGLAVVGNEEMKDENYSETVYSYLKPPEAIEGHAFSVRSDVYRFLSSIDKESVIC